MRHSFLATAASIAATGVLAITPASAAPAGEHGDDAGDGGRYEIALIGDMPYGDTGRAQYPAVIAAINAAHVRFTAFDGDIKNGKERCDQPLYDLAASEFAMYRRPVVYVPGDNEWTDCDRPSNGSYDPNERLALVRRMFATGPTSLGQRGLRLERQSAAYPENVRWDSGDVFYIGVNVPGSDDNAPQFDATGKQIDGDQAEYAARNEAVLAWLSDSFARAQARHARAIMVVLQADMWSTADPTQHFADTKAALARLTVAYSGQVVLVNGDSHTFIVDKPLTDAAGNVIENFTRVQTFGSAQNHWVSATIDPADPNVFTFRPHVIAANVPAYTLP
ncbi:hypothetical protein [Hamadaea tsunoensis]|uniref:hypothetical protein n=1 Tax=Hamadaea tsunoensis TaxID=53368 RepID=UPI0003FB7DBE|nr:hypothetical protein [Hamadaea tsunoensis]